MDKITVVDGTTPIDKAFVNQLQANINTLAYHLAITSNVSAGANITIPCKYKVGANVLDVYFNGEYLPKSTSTTDLTTGCYAEIGTSGAISNIIATTTDWSVSSGDYFDFIVRGEYT